MKTAVVTGSAGGIGTATVAAFEGAGFTVHGVDRGESFPALDRLDALVCAHGISGRRLGDGPVETCTEAGWDAVLDANLKSVFLYAKQAIPALRANGGGAIVTLSSALGLVGGDDDFATHAYAASKAGVIGLTRAMAVTYARDGIRVNCICPGTVETPFVDGYLEKFHKHEIDKVRQELHARQPVGRMGRPDEIAHLALYLCSKEAEFVTGSSMTIDGGWTAM